MIDAKVLLTDLTRLLKRLEDDLRERALSPNSAVPELRGQLQAEWQAARDAERTAETFESWAEQVITQAGVHWLLSCVFLRFIEDNGLVDRPWISGTPQSGRLALARDSHDAHFRAHPHQNDRDFLIASFREAGALPGLHTFFEEAHNPVFRLGISGDAAMAVMQFWQEVAADSGLLVRDFTDPAWNTRFLGDLYQDLSEATRKRYALLQTPEFVEEFILNRTLTPAIQEFGYREARLIDPTCGSGHFLLGAFHRLVEEWVRNEPGRNPADVAQKALDAVAGVDLNPFAVAIARFRLLLAALQVSQVQSLAAARDFKIHVAIGDSLLHGKRFGLTGTGDMFQRAEDFSSTGLAHAYLTEDLESVQLILGRQYHAVVGNPPYIVVSDAALNGAYRSKYASCHRQYSLGAPFTERFFELAVTGRDGLSAGFVGLITANSFMKREFGSKLIEQVLPRLDLTHVIDTAAANIPGHGTPTVIIFGRHRPPVGERLRVVMGIKGEPMTPVDPSQGLVWTSILRQIDVVGSESEYISVQDMPRSALNSHPWSIGGGGAGDLKALIESNSASRLSSAIAVHRYTYFVGNRQVTRETVEIGFVGMTHADEAMVASPEAFRRKRVESQVVAPLVVGDEVRDWTFAAGSSVLLPHSQDEVVPIEEFPGMHRWLWPFRTTLGNRATFGKSTYFEEGRPWWAWHQIALRRVSTPPILTFSFIATHSHFAIDRGGNIFKQSAPVIKLRPTVTLDAMQGITGLLNSSIACFWLQQVCHNKGGPGGGSSKDEKWHDFYEFSSTNIAEFPLIEDLPVALARRLDELGQQYRSNMPAAALAAEHLPSRAALDAAKERAGVLRRQMFAAQEELDWRCYRSYGLLDEALESEAPPEINLGERAFEIMTARRMADGGQQTRWFEWLGVKPVIDLPSHWPNAYKSLIERRIALIETDRMIGLVESANCKRRWESVAWESIERAALKNWLLARLESPHYWKTNRDQPPQLTTTNRLADLARRDEEFHLVAKLYAGHADFDPSKLVADLVGGEAVPFLPVLRYADTGLRKRAQWEQTWEMQRRDDSGEGVGKIPVPPKYQTKDFLRVDFWRLRGGLDLDEERWISYPGCERGADGSLPIAWAGWDHLQQAMALASYFIDMKEREGWSRERLQPLLAGLLELVPWLKQWHNEMNPDFGARMGDYYESFVSDEARALQFTLDDLRAWKPPVTAAKRGRKKAA